MKELATRLIRRRRIFKYFQHCGHGNQKSQAIPHTQSRRLAVQIVVEGFVGNNNDSFFNFLFVLKIVFLISIFFRLFLINILTVVCI